MRFTDWIFATLAMFSVILFIVFPIFHMTCSSGFNNKHFRVTTITPMTAVITAFCYY